MTLKRSLTILLLCTSFGGPLIAWSADNFRGVTVASMVAGKLVDVVDHGRDQYGRTVGSLSVGDLDVNAEQVKAGYAWVYARYNRDSRLPALEEEARRGQLGLWRDPKPTAPWEYRHSR